MTGACLTGRVDMSAGHGSTLAGAGAAFGGACLAASQSCSDGCIKKALLLLISMVAIRITAIDVSIMGHFVLGRVLSNLLWW